MNRLYHKLHLYFQHMLKSINDFVISNHKYIVSFFIQWLLGFSILCNFIVIYNQIDNYQFCIYYIVVAISYVIYILIYSRLKIHISTRSFLAFLGNVLVLCLYILGLVNLIKGLPNPIYLENLSTFSYYRYMLFLAFALIGIFLYLLLKANFMTDHITTLANYISFPYFKEEIRLLLASRNTNHFKFMIISFITYNPAPHVMKNLTLFKDGKLQIVKLSLTSCRINCKIGAKRNNLVNTIYIFRNELIQNSKLRLKSHITSSCVYSPLYTKSIRHFSSTVLIISRVTHFCATPFNMDLTMINTQTVKRDPNSTRVSSTVVNQIRNENHGFVNNKIVRPYTSCPGIYCPRIFCLYHCPFNMGIRSRFVIIMLSTLSSMIPNNFIAFYQSFVKVDKSRLRCRPSTLNRISGFYTDTGIFAKGISTRTSLNAKRLFSSLPLSRLSTHLSRPTFLYYTPKLI
jgi:hypothetical protein